jgi:uncharacterized iron-regulated protein
MFSLILLLLAVAAAGSAGPPVTPPPAFLLLGEVHDNTAAHRARFTYLETLIERGWRPLIVMEQFDRERADDLSRALATCDNADCVVKSAGSRGWDWPLYHPLLELALKYRLRVAAANLSRADATRVVREGINAVIAGADARDFGLPESVSAALREAQLQRIEAGHCGLAPPKLAQGMTDAQIARDLWMAKVMLENAGHGVVLIAGNGHVRRDWGVPYWLRLRGHSDIRSIGYVEADDAADQTQFDVGRTVPPQPRPDPCAGLKFSAPPPP